MKTTTVIDNHTVVIRYGKCQYITASTANMLDTDERRIRPVYVTVDNEDEIDVGYLRRMEYEYPSYEFVCEDSELTEVFHTDLLYDMGEFAREAKRETTRNIIEGLNKIAN